MVSQVIGELVQNDLAFLRLILPFGRFPMEHRFPISDQRAQFVFQPNQMAVGFAEAQPLAGDASLEAVPFMTQLHESRIIRQPHRPMPRLMV